MGTVRGPADLVLCVGSSHVLSTEEPPRHTAEALRELRRLVADGGRVLLGEGFWQRPPTTAELSGMWPEARADEHYDLGTLLDLAVAAGFRPEWTETANADEWEEFESAYQADAEVWLAGHGDHPCGRRDTRAPRPAPGPMDELPGRVGARISHARTHRPLRTGVRKSRESGVRRGGFTRARGHAGTCTVSTRLATSRSRSRRAARLRSRRIWLMPIAWSTKITEKAME